MLGHNQRAMIQSDRFKSSKQQRCFFLQMAVKKQYCHLQLFFLVHIQDIDGQGHFCIIGLSYHHHHDLLCVQEVSVLEKDVPARRFSRTRLFSPGRILHITYRKNTGADK
jgi:hypothetical protein